MSSSVRATWSSTCALPLKVPYVWLLAAVRKTIAPSHRTSCWRVYSCAWAWKFREYRSSHPPGTSTKSSLRERAIHEFLNPVYPVIWAPNSRQRPNLSELREFDWAGSHHSASDPTTCYSRQWRLGQGRTRKISSQISLNWKISPVFASWKQLQDVVESVKNV